MTEPHTMVSPGAEHMRQRSPVSHVQDVGSPLAPVGERERLMAVDALRGFAVLGIFMMNIVLFGLPLAVMVDPMGAGAARYAGEFAGLNLAVWLIQHLFFDLKMMTIFSMLFGAGLALMAVRAGGRGGSFAGIYYRRIAWLLIMGMLHAYLFWYGDILAMYAICGLLLYPMRNLRARVLIPLGGVLLVIPMVLCVAFGVFMGMARDAAVAAEAKLAAGETPTYFEADMLETWPLFEEEFHPSAEEVDRQVAAFRGSADEVLLENAGLAAYSQLEGGLFFIWRPAGLMLIGMALMRMGVFSAVLPRRCYAGLVVVGYLVGLPIVGVGAWDLLAHEFDQIRTMLISFHYNYIGSLFVAFGHVGAVMLLCKSGMARGLVSRLAAVGRMALTNYLAQTLLATTFFFGWGFGLFGALDRTWLMLVVVSVWALQLAWSPWWLSRFRYGPAEWAWRTLTYFHVQPMRR